MNRILLFVTFFIFINNNSVLSAAISMNGKNKLTVHEYSQKTLKTKEKEKTAEK